MNVDRLTGIDDTNREQHSYLGPSDVCYFLGEYFGGVSYRGGATNQLIFNLKCTPTKAAQNPNRSRYKESAIVDVAATLRRILSTADIEGHTWVPIPTSKRRGHPDFDPRLQRILEAAFRPVGAALDADIRPLLQQTQDTEADHSSGSRISPEQLATILAVDQEMLAIRPIRRRGVLLFDDVLTSGKHFRCCGQVLRAAVAGAPVKGLFIARRVWQGASADEFPAPPE